MAVNGLNNRDAWLSVGCIQGRTAVSGLHNKDGNLSVGCTIEMPTEMYGCQWVAPVGWLSVSGLHYRDTVYEVDSRDTCLFNDPQHKK